MSNISPFPNKVPKDAGSEPPDNDAMEARVAKLEDFAVDARDRLTRIETKLDNMDSAMATKSEMHDMKAEMVKWIVGAAIGLGVAGITVMTFVLNNAVPKAQATQPVPIIINVPSQVPTQTIAMPPAPPKPASSSP